MPQFAVHRNRNAATKARFPLLLDVQSDLLEILGTRVVIPLTPVTSATKRTAIRMLTPILSIENKQYLLVTPQLAGIAARELGDAVADLTAHRQVILDAVDLLITGI